MSTNPIRIEEAALNAWHPLQNILYDGWVLRFAQGYTKRANSVNPLFPSTIDLPQKIEICEKYYQDKNLPPIFRLPTITTPKGLDALLEKKGYKQYDLTDVMQISLKDKDFVLSENIEFGADDFDSWLAYHGKWNNIAPERRELHAKLLKNIPTTPLFATLKDTAGNPIACGLGVLDAEYLGIFDLVTAPDERKKGYGTNLLSGILKWGAEKGAKHAYLQVMRANEAAQRLYQREGFTPAYHYWYRVPADF